MLYLTVFNKGLCYNCKVDYLSISIDEVSIGAGYNLSNKFKW